MRNYWPRHKKWLNINNRVRSWKKLLRHDEEGLDFRSLREGLSKRWLGFAKIWGGTVSGPSGE